MAIDNIFNIATTGLTAQRLAIEVTSENITNVNTAGYSRQITQFETGQTNTVNGFALGTGVKVAAIQRSYDGLLQKQIVDGNSSYQQNLARQTALQQIEPLFNEMTTDGLGKTVQDFLGSWNDLALNPQGLAERQTVIARGQTMVDAFNNTSSSLQDVQQNANDSLPVIADTVSATAKQIASLNMQILETEHLGVNANELRDQRDQLITDLSQKAGVTFSEVGYPQPDSPDKTIQVKLPGGETLVNGGNYAQLYAKTTTPPNNDLYLTATGNPPPTANSAVDTKVSATIGGLPQGSNSLGEIGGVLQVRDTIVPDLMNNMNELARQIGDAVNRIHMAGYGLDSSTGNAFFSGVSTNPTTATGTFAASGDVITVADTSNLQVGMGVTDPASAIPAGAKITEVINGTSFRISQPATAAGAGVNLTFSGMESSALRMNPNLTVNSLAAADTDPVVGGTGNNRTALALADLQNTAIAFTTKVNGVSSPSNTTIGNYYTSLVSSVGVQVQNATTATTQGDSFLQQLNTLRESNSGVSLDEELTNLIKYQKAFEGSSRLISTATDMMDTILGLVR